MKSPKKRTWIPRPAVMTFSPRSLSFFDFALASIPPPIVPCHSLDLFVLYGPAEEL